MAAPILKPYRVTLPGGRSTVLRLRAETAAERYPGAVELKVGPAPSTPEGAKTTRRSTKNAAK